MEIFKLGYLDVVKTSEICWVYSFHQFLKVSVMG